MEFWGHNWIVGVGQTPICAHPTHGVRVDGMSVSDSQFPPPFLSWFSAPFEGDVFGHSRGSSDWGFFPSQNDWPFLGSGAQTNERGGGIGCEWGEMTSAECAGKLFWPFLLILLKKDNQKPGLGGRGELFFQTWSVTSWLQRKWLAP